MIQTILSLALWLSLFCFAAVTYFLPTTIALMRKHHQGAAIAVLNLLLGWTFLGWVLALVWSLTATYRR